ncbi:MAG: PhzF family phenazine biosynthesis protein [Pseudoxanthomonas sp.]
MAARRYLQLDVFADRPDSGNPLGVVLDAADLTTASMQALAAWLNLSETVFFLPPDQAGADYRIRIFTPGSELPFAGHPSVGAAWAAVETGLARGNHGRLVQQCPAGLLPARVEETARGRAISLRSPAAHRVDMPMSDLPDDLRAIAAPGIPVELWNNGPSWWLVQAASAHQVRALRPNLAAIAAWTNATNATGVAVFAAEAAGSHDLVLRAFCPGDAVNVPKEDPVTGSANALAAAALAQRNSLPGPSGRYVASQGREVGRDGRVQVEVDGQGQVWIGGYVQPVIHGTLAW